MPGDPHEQPAPQLEAADRTIAARRGSRAGGCAPAAARRDEARWWSPSQSLIRSMIWPPMTHVTGAIEARNRVSVMMPDDADVLREAREEVDQQDLDAVERVVQHRGDQPELEQPHDRVLVDANDAVVGVGPPADDGGVDHVGEQEQDDRDAGDPVEQPGPLALMALVDGAVVALLLARSGRHSGIPPRLSRGRRLVTHRTGQRPRGVYSVPARWLEPRGQPMRIATITPSRVGTIVET